MRCISCHTILLPNISRCVPHWHLGGLPPPQTPHPNPAHHVAADGMPRIRCRAAPSAESDHRIVPGQDICMIIILVPAGVIPDTSRYVAQLGGPPKRLGLPPAPPHGRRPCRLSPAQHATQCMRNCDFTQKRLRGLIGALQPCEAPSADAAVCRRSVHIGPHCRQTWYHDAWPLANPHLPRGGSRV